MDPRARRFAIGVAVAWLLLPLFGGLAGLGFAFTGVTLPFVDQRWDYGQLAGWGVLGCVAGAVLATGHTVWSYWRTYLR